MSEINKLIKWLQVEREKGLVSIHISEASGATNEQLAAEINRMLSAPVIKDENFF